MHSRCWNHRNQVKLGTSVRQYENTETQVTVGKGYYKEAFAGFQRWKSGEALMSVCSHFYGPTHPLFLEKIYFKIPKIYPPLVLQHCHFVHKIYIYIYTYTHTHTHTHKPWPVWFSWLEHHPVTKRLQVQFPVRAHA